MVQISEVPEVGITSSIIVHCWLRAIKMQKNLYALIFGELMSSENSKQLPTRAYRDAENKKWLWLWLFKAFWFQPSAMAMHIVEEARRIGNSLLIFDNQFSFDNNFDKVVGCLRQRNLVQLQAWCCENGGSTTKALLKEFWDQISAPSFDSRFQADEYAAILMEELDPMKSGNTSMKSGAVHSIAAGHSIANIFTPKQHISVYSSVRRDVLDKCMSNLDIEKLSIDEVQQIEWRLLDEKMQKWVPDVKLVIQAVQTLLTDEKALCELIFMHGNVSDSQKIDSFTFISVADELLVVLMINKFVIPSMEEVENISLKGKTTLFDWDYPTLAALLNRNFDLQRSMFGDEALGALNIEMVKMARRVGAALKFTGSEGAVVVFCPDGHSLSNLAAVTLLYILTNDGQDGCLLLKPVLSDSVKAKGSSLGNKLPSIRIDRFAQLLENEHETFNIFFVNKEEEYILRFKELQDRVATVKDYTDEMLNIRKEIVHFHGKMVLLENYNAQDIQAGRLEGYKLIFLDQISA